MSNLAHDHSGIRGENASFQEIVEEALELLARERALFLTGDYEKIPQVSGQKISVLERIEDAIPFAPQTRATIAVIEELVIASRRNEEIIQAARQGLAHARRRISSIREARRGVVAYAEDGSQIASHADLIGREKSA